MYYRGDIWDADLEPVTGHEQGRKRPVLIVSDDTLNNGPGEIVVAVPITSTNRRIPLHVPVAPPDGGLTNPSYILCDHVRSISTKRLLSKRGEVSSGVMAEVEDRLRIILRL